MHRIIRSQADLAVAHKLILRLLDAVRALKLKVNTAGVLQRHWRLGQRKSWPAYRWEAQIKYLGIQISYGSFEKQTLRYRTAEAAKKLQQVRRFVYNRRHAGPRARLRVWFHNGVGHIEETARLLRGWYAHKLRSVSCESNAARPPVQAAFYPGSSGEA